MVGPHDLDQPYQKDSAMTDEHILFRVEAGIANLTLNRPTKHNAITAAVGGGNRPLVAADQHRP